MAEILVINPNSTAAVTEGLDAAVAPLRFAGGPSIRCITLEDGPAGIQSQRDVDFVVAPLCRRIAFEAADAYVIACFSDPGLHAARETVAKPVIGIMEAGMTHAMTLGQRIGVIAILHTSIARHIRAFRAMGVAERVVGERPVGLNVVELSDEKTTRDRLITVGRMLVNQDSADVIVLGCAGMARYRPALEEALETPVVDPTQAAVGLAITQLQFGLRQRRI